MIWFALFDDEKILGIIITICLIISLLCAKGTASFYAKQYNGKGQEKTKKNHDVRTKEDRDADGQETHKY